MRGSRRTGPDGPLSPSAASGASNPPGTASRPGLRETAGHGRGAAIKRDGETAAKHGGETALTRGREAALWVTLPLALGLLVVLSTGLGTVRIPPLTVLETLLGALGLPFGKGGTAEYIVLQIRLPRTLVTALVGSSLAVAGAALQGLFRNPMASPDILGISAGGSLGAVTAIYSSLSTASIVFMPIMTVAGSLTAAAAIYALSTYRGRTSLLFIILSGMAISSLLSGLISLVLLFSNQYEISQFLFWTMGGLENRRWEHVIVSAPVLLAGQAFMFLFATDLNLFLFGEHSAHSLGIPVETRKKLILLAAAVLTGVSVSVSGTIGFIGLLIPHLLRLVLGPDHRRLLPASALTGACFLLACDTLGRVIVPPYEIRVGIITALAGAPYFIYLIVRSQRRSLYG